MLGACAAFVRRVAMASTVAAIGCGVWAGQSSAYIYWTSSDTNAIGRANQNGSGVNQDFLVTGSLSELGQIAIDSSHIYWTSPQSGTIGRANIDGTDPEPDFISGLTEPSGLAVSSSYIYWTDPAGGAGASAGTIGRADIDGKGVERSFVTGVSFPGKLALGNGRLYWDSGALFDGPDNQHIGFALGDVELGGSGLDQTLVPEAYGGPAVNGSHIFWANYIPVGEPQLGYNTIGEANLNGSDVNESFIALGGDQLDNGASDVAVDSQYVYWTYSFFETGWIGRASIDGSGVEQHFITGITPGSIAVNEASSSSSSGSTGSAPPRRARRRSSGAAARSN